MEDLGRRITAARAYAGISRESLANSIGLEPVVLERIEAGLDDHDEKHKRSLVADIATATRVPEQFLTVDYADLSLEPTAEDQMGRLDLFSSAMMASLRRIETKLGVEQD